VPASTHHAREAPHGESAQLHTGRALIVGTGWTVKHVLFGLNVSCSKLASWLAGQLIASDALS